MLVLPLPILVITAVFFPLILLLLVIAAVRLPLILHSCSEAVPRLPHGAIPALDGMGLRRAEQVLRRMSDNGSTLPHPPAEVRRSKR